MSAEPAPPRSVGPVPLYGGVFLTGVATVLLGPLIPEMREHWGVSAAVAASLFVAQFATSSLGALVSSRHLRFSLAGGFLSIAAGLALLSTGAWPLAGWGMSLVGLGLGLTVPASNLVAALQNPRGRGAALNVLNLVWGTGAVSCPLLFAAARGRVPIGMLLASVAVACVVVGLVFATRVRGGLRPATRAGGSGEERRQRPRLAMVAAMLFLYVGIETSIGGWLVTLSDRVGAAPALVSLLIGSGFWAALLLGRAGAAAWLRKRSEVGLYRASLAVAGAGTLALLVSGSRVGLAFGALVAGIGLAAVFPLTVSILATETAHRGGRSTGWVFACGGCGGALLPWLSGQFSAGSSRPTTGLAVPALALALLSLVFVTYRRKARADGRL